MSDQREHQTDEPESVVERVEEGLEDVEQRLLAELREETRQLRAEVHLLHQRLEVMHAHQHLLRRASFRHHWLSVFIHQLEYEPKVQYKVHQIGAYFWVVNAIVVTLALIFFNDQWQAIAVFYVAIVSLYANFSTDYGAMSAALAAQHQPPLPEIPLETHVDQDEDQAR